MALGAVPRAGCAPLSSALSPRPRRQGFEPISPPPTSAAGSTSYPVCYGVAVGKAEPPGKAKELPKVVEGSSEEEEEEVDHELVEKKVKWALAVTMPLGFPTAIARRLWGWGTWLGACRDQGHHWVLAGAGVLLVACKDQGLVGCLWGVRVSRDVRGDQGRHQMLMGKGGIAGRSEGPGALLGAGRDIPGCSQGPGTSVYAHWV